MVKKIISLIAALIISIGLFPACSNNELTIEEHIERITGKLQKNTLMPTKRLPNKDIFLVLTPTENLKDWRL